MLRWITVFKTAINKNMRIDASYEILIYKTNAKKFLSAGAVCSPQNWVLFHWVLNIDHQKRSTHL